jgi:hypothetical protein
MTERTDQAHPNDARTRSSVPEAAQLLGISAEAVRSRVQWQTLKSTKVDGTVYVLLDTDQARPTADEDGTRIDARARLDDDQTASIDNKTRSSGCSGRSSVKTRSSCRWPKGFSLSWSRRESHEKPL